MIVSDEVLLPRRVVPQPEPMLVAGGDCGACVLAGLTGLSVADVYAELNEGKVDSFTRYGMRQALYRAVSRELLDRIVTEPPSWPQVSTHGWGCPGYAQALHWGGWIRLAIEAGYYPTCQVNFDRAGFGSDPDHYLMLAGVREVRVPVGGGARIETHVLVSCSARSSPDEEWVEVGAFLRERGGFDAMLARPA